jgi:hypothetical protein
MTEDSSTAEAFWRLGPLPAQDEAEPDGVALDRLGRPAVTVDGRNLADVLRPVYRAITAD